MLANQALSTPPTTAASPDQVTQDGAGRLWTSLGQALGLQMAWRRLPAFRDLQALSDSLSFATLPKSLLSSFLNSLRHVPKEWVEIPGATHHRLYDDEAAVGKANITSRKYRRILNADVIKASRYRKKR